MPLKVAVLSSHLLNRPRTVLALLKIQNYKLTVLPSTGRVEGVCRSRISGVSRKKLKLQINFQRFKLLRM